MRPACHPHAGRFAPSPSGALHFGSLVAALASYLQARHHGAPWYVRIEDVDTPRVVPGSADDILRTLAAFGLIWDGPVVYQSQRGAAYARAVRELQRAGMAFDCGCTRKQAHDGPMGVDGPIYPGTCRDGVPAGRQPRVVRARVTNEVIRVTDAVMGDIEQRLDQDVGDFIIRRFNGCHAYQLAVVLDDAYQGVGEVVRGGDLLSSTPRQVYLMRLLGLAQPRHMHLPVLVDARGNKLGKSQAAMQIRGHRPMSVLLAALRVLGQQPLADLANADVATLLAWACKQWNPAAIPACSTMPCDAVLPND